ncbi:glycoside hydrolase family 3 C-terminal domain-containing protein [Streptomyces luteogriseus]|uniref:glycoside hydrolase family 3 C-terminal domain-containing protein n=1 Tax=Streptomyces luteogriseus TaxID=68233 RepID=UPI00378C6840
MRLMRWPAVIAAACAALGGSLIAPTTAPAATANADCPWVGQRATPSQRAEQVLARMTLDEKIQMVHGAASSSYAGLIPGIARLCVPALKMQDGPVGVRMRDTTQLPAAAAVAASFDTSLAKSYGQVIGAEDKAKGVDVDLGPTVNIVRDPRWGRAFESYSEDPHLTGEMGSADIEGIQSQGVMAQVKHFAVYNQETNRNTPADNAIVDDRVVREIYTAAFGTIVAKARPSSAMCSYSSVNGTYACENAYLNNILKTGFGFDGFITSDWDGTHSTVQSANAGMDMQMPNDSYFGAALKQAVQNGRVAQSRVDDMVTRILRQEFRFGLFDHPSADTPDAHASTPAHVAVAKQVAEDGTVLLKNAGNVLPLDKSKVRSIAVIGNGAKDNTMSGGGGSAAVSGTGTVSPYDGIKARAGSGVDVRYAQGNAGTTGDYGALPAIDSQYLTPPSGTGHGLKGEYYTNTTLSGPPAATRTDRQVKFDWLGTPVSGLPATNFSTKWTGTVTPPVTGTYTFGVTSDDGSRLFINGEKTIDNWRDQGATTETAKVDLTAGKPVRIEVDYYQGTGGGSVSLGWMPPSAALTQQAAALAAKSDVAVVYANNYASEGRDLADIGLPGDQNDLIDAVAAANPHTIVVLNTGSAVTMPWIDKVKGVFEAWYPGQQAGNAIAALLFGDANPSGKLPVTFPTSLDHVPAATDAQWPGADGKVRYSEGLKVGYRWYDAKKLTPLFPFGHGLSYTTFKFSGLRLSTPTMPGTGHIRAGVDVTNTGKRAGAEVAQLYLSAPAATGEPPRQLKGFKKVYLRPGQTKRVTFDISTQDASYWNTSAQGWTFVAGAYAVRVGDSSRSLPLSDTFRVARTVTHGTQYTTVKSPTSAQQGSSVSVTTRFTNGATVPVRHAVTALTVPRGWKATAKSPKSFPRVGPGQTVSTTWSVTVPADTAGGAATLSAATEFTGSDRRPQPSGSATLTVAYSDLAAAYDKVGVTDDSDTSAGNFDGWGNSYSAQALAAVGVTPGGTVTAGTSRFTWPDVPPGKPNQVNAAGQIIGMNGSGTKLSLLGAGASGTQSGQLTVTYTDGTTSTARVSFADWWADQPVDGGTLAVTAAYLNQSDGTRKDQHVSLFTAAVPLTAGKQVASITLPDNQNMHLFAATIS